MAMRPASATQLESQAPGAQVEGRGPQIMTPGQGQEQDQNPPGVTMNGREIKVGAKGRVEPSAMSSTYSVVVVEAVGGGIYLILMQILILMPLTICLYLFPSQWKRGDQSLVPVETVTDRIPRIFLSFF